MFRYSGVALRPLLFSVPLACGLSCHILCAQSTTYPSHPVEAIRDQGVEPKAPQPTPVNAATPDAFQVRYAANLWTVSSVVNISNSGATSVPNSPLGGTGGNICVNIYTFDTYEVLLSCCSCFVTPNALVSLDVRASLLSNTLTSEVPNGAVIELVATAGTSQSGCNPSLVTASGLAAGMRAWGTTAHSLTTKPGSYVLAETPFANATLGAGELSWLTAVCAFIQVNGSGQGICKGCQTGGLGAVESQ